MPMSGVVRRVAPLVRPPAAQLFRAALALLTPALVYDLDGLRRSVATLVEDVGEVGTLNLALKACHTPSVLAELASLGLGADVASIGEYRLARAAGFTRITATGPSFTTADAAELRAGGVVLDASSVEQLERLCRAFPGSPVGVRLRVPLPDDIERDATTFGRVSRFGVEATDPRWHAVLARWGCPLVRLHMHTGQMTPEHLLHKTRYALAVAEAFPSVDTIDLGGGFFSLYASRGRAIAGMRTVGREVQTWRARTGRPMALQFEPGGGILGPHGFLFVSVLSVERDHPAFGADVVTVDASAWNLAPWHRPEVLFADPDVAGAGARRTLVAGNTLYENDFFGADVRGALTAFDLPACAAGDRLVLTAAGAYTMTNSRRFNRIDPPAEHAWSDGSLRSLA